MVEVGGDPEKLAAVPGVPEKQTLLSKYNIPIQCLEFEYIGKCKDGRELEKILQILRSGQEGYFPQLVEFTEKRLTEVKPKSKYLLKVCPALSKAQLEKGHWDEISNDLTEWMQDMNKQDRELDARRAPLDTDFHNIEVRKVPDKLNEPSAKPQPTRIPSTDYESWDKYDPDTEMLKMDLEEEKFKKQSEKIEQMKKPKAISFDYSFYTEAEANFTATSEKERGNEYFKVGEYSNALRHYTNSLRCRPLAASYTNRALVYNKLGKHSRAIDDCKAALKIEPGNFKAYLRMAEAYEALKSYEEALVIVERAIELDPNNTFAQQLANRVRPKMSGETVQNRRFTIEDVCVRAPKSILKNAEQKRKLEGINEETETKCGNKELKEIRNNNRLQINWKPPEDDKVVPKQTETKGKIKARRKYWEIVPIPGTSKMLPPFYEVVSSNSLQIIEAERSRILNAPHLIYLMNIDMSSDEEDQIPICPEDGLEKYEMENFKIDSDEGEKRKCKDVRKLKIKRKSSWNATTQAAQVNKKRTERNCGEGGSGEPHKDNNQNAWIPTIEEFQTPYTFIEAWNSIRKDHTFEQLAEILKKLDFERIDQIIGYKLDDEILSSFISCLHRHFMVPGELDRVRSVLTNITRIPRFKMIALFLTKSDWIRAEQLIQFLAQHGRDLPDNIKQFYSHS